MPNDATTETRFVPRWRSSEHRILDRPAAGFETVQALLDFVDERVRRNGTIREEYDYVEVVTTKIAHALPEPPFTEPTKVGALVIDHDEDIWARDRDGAWRCLTRPSMNPLRWPTLARDYGPLKPYSVGA